MIGKADASTEIRYEVNCGRFDKSRFERHQQTKIRRRIHDKAREYTVTYYDIPYTLSAQVRGGKLKWSVTIQKLNPIEEETFEGLQMMLEAPRALGSIANRQTNDQGQPNVVSVASNLPQNDLPTAGPSHDETNVHTNLNGPSLPQPRRSLSVSNVPSSPPIEDDSLSMNSIEIGHGEFQASDIPKSETASPLAISPTVEPERSAYTVENESLETSFNLMSGPSLPSTSHDSQQFDVADSDTDNGRSSSNVLQDLSSPTRFADRWRGRVESSTNKLKRVKKPGGRVSAEVNTIWISGEEEEEEEEQQVEMPRTPPKRTRGNRNAGHGRRRRSTESRRGKATGHANSLPSRSRPMIEESSPPLVLSGSGFLPINAKQGPPLTEPRQSTRRTRNHQNGLSTSTIASELPHHDYQGPSVQSPSAGAAPDPPSSSSSTGKRKRNVNVTHENSLGRNHSFDDDDDDDTISVVPPSSPSSLPSPFLKGSDPNLTRDPRRRPPPIASTSALPERWNVFH